MTIGSGELGTVSMRIGDVEIKIWQEYCFSSHFLVPTDGFRFSIADERIADELFPLLVPGRKVQLLINGRLQFTGYLDVADFSGDRSSGSLVVLEGRDTFGPVVDSEIDPRKRYPDKTLISKLLEDTLEPFGFTTFFIDNESNSNIAAGKAISRPKKASKKKLNQYPIPQSKPKHNESYFDFISRISQREHLWIWPGVDGESVIVSVPDFDQPARYQIRRRRGGNNNNILSGGIRYDATGQPSYLVATGSIPPTEHQHAKTMLVADNPYTMNPFDPEKKGGFAIQSAGEIVATSLGLSTASKGQQSQPGQQGGEVLTFSAAAIREHQELFKWSTFTPVKPIQIPNRFASTIARPKYVKDTESRTLEQLKAYAQRQMSLYVRKAVVGRYTFEGHELDGQPVTIDSVVDVQDDRSNWHGPMWILSVERRKSRGGGTTTTIETLPMNSLVF